MGPSPFGARLKELREAAGLTQKALAEKVGMALRSISRFETGEREPEWSGVQALAEALGVDCLAFAQEPADRPPPGRGRPPKSAPSTPPAGDLEAVPKKPRGRPR
jgi:transcriptional regulator with XRE-family HTH domain